MAYLHGKFVWFELMTNDVEKAKAFYSELFGWKIDGVDMGTFTYHMAKNGENGVGGLMALQEKDKMPSSWMAYVSVPDVDAFAKKVTAAGGKIIVAPQDIPKVGRFSVVVDPQGAAFSLFKSADGDGADRQPGPGDFCWNELWTSDAKAAVKFYTETFGYTVGEMDMGPMGMYYLLKTGDAMRGGLMKSPVPGVPPNWLPYVGVADADGTVERAKKLGAQVTAPPSDIPDVGRFAILTDPTGATIAVLQPAPQAAK
jgi:uncharacterized protein